MTNWKTTVAGILGAFTVTIGPLSGFLGAWQAIQAQIPGHAPANYTIPLIGAGLTAAGAIASAWIHILMTDGATANQIGQIAVASVATGTPPTPSAPLPPTDPTPATK